jgi:hypothetical protein
MKRLLSILIVLLTSCHGDYSIEGSMTQTVNVENIDYLVIECYCDKGVDITESPTNTIRIDVKGSSTSVGYHGEQKTPNNIGEQTLSFKTEVKNHTLRLVSKEWKYIHHSYLINELDIQIPKKIKYEIVKIPERQLVGKIK